jgi:hypothetical protein
LPIHAKQRTPIPDTFYVLACFGYNELKIVKGGNDMGAPKEQFDRLFELLSESEKKSLLEHMKNLVAKKAWDRIAELETDDVPLNEEEREQFEDPDKEYVSWEDVKRELGLKV